MDQRQMSGVKNLNCRYNDIQLKNPMSWVLKMMGYLIRILIFYNTEKTYIKHSYKLYKDDPNCRIQIQLINVFRVFVRYSIVS